jgi:hypothetical protein
VSRITRIARRQDGSSLLEMLMVITVMGIISGLAVLQIGSAGPYIRGDGAMRTVIAQMTTARELAIAQRRNIQVAFVGSVITVTRQNIAIGAAPVTTTVMAAIPLEGGVQFGLTTGAPADTPDGFAAGITAASPGVYFATATSAFFTSDGSLISSAGLPVNATVFLTLPNQPRGTRAVTVLGASGRIRAYQWDGTQSQFVRR